MLEEAEVAYRAGRPLFVLGGFGGVGAVLADRLMNRTPSPPPEIDEYAPLATWAQAHLGGTPGVSPADGPFTMFCQFPAAPRDLGAALRNGLDHDENRELLGTTVVEHAVRLVTKGLGRLAMDKRNELGLGWHEVALSVSTAAPAQSTPETTRNTLVELFRSLTARLLSERAVVAYGGALKALDAPEIDFTTLLYEEVAKAQGTTSEAARAEAQDQSGAGDGDGEADWDDPPMRARHYAAAPQLVGGPPADRPTDEAVRLWPCDPEPTPRVADGGDALVRDALAYTAMRQKMGRNCTARVVVGGRLTGYRGRYPGVIEEALLQLDNGGALFVLGGFGGAAQALARRLAGGLPKELTDHWQQNNEDATEVDGEPLLPRLRDALAGTPYQIDLEGDLARLLPRNDLTALRNGLDEEENRELLETEDVERAVALVIEGLRRIPEPVGDDEQPS